MSEVGLCGTLFSVNFWAYYYVVTLKLSLLISVLGHFDQKLQKNFMTMDILEYKSTICHAKKMFEIGLLSYFSQTYIVSSKQKNVLMLNYRCIAIVFTLIQMLH